MRPPPQSFFTYPLTTILGSQRGVRVVRALSRHGGALSSGRIAAEIGVAPSNVRTALAELVMAGMVRTHGQGRAQSYSLDATHPLALAAQQLFAAEAARRDRVLSGLREAAARLDPTPLGLWIYGSAARGTDTVSSDIDIALCVAEPQVLESQTDALRDVAARLDEMEHVHISIISLTSADAQRLADEDADLWNGLVHDGVVLFGRPPGAIATRRPT